LTLGIALVAAAAAYETAQLVTAAGLRANSWFAAGAAFVAVIGVWIGRPFMEFLDLFHQDSTANLVFGFVAIVVIVSALIGISQRDPRTGFVSWAGNVIAALYPSLLGSAAVILEGSAPIPDKALLNGSLDSGRVWILILVLTVWSLDSAAYVCGRYVPRGHFFNHISPNKTWSGAIGGTAAALLVCTYLAWAAGQEPLVGIAVGALIAVAAQAGDLAESMLKRAAAVKDSGTLIPGHGGMLDRVDSFLFAAPVLFLSLNWLGIVRWW